MPSCEACRQQLLAYLYDLLEPAEHEAAEAHLRDCPACQAELVRARRQRSDITAAVKSPFPDVVFKAPASRAVVRPAAAPGRPPRPPRPPRRPWLLNPWTIAAAVTLMVFSSGMAIAWSLSAYQDEEVERARQQLSKAQADLRDAQVQADARRGDAEKKARAIQDEIDKLFTRWQELDQGVRQDVKQQRVRFEVKGPKAIQAGAPNHYEIQVKPADPKQPPHVTKVRARVVDEKTQAVLFEKALAAQGVQLITLPQDLPVKPGDDVALELEADADGAPAQAREKLDLEFPEYVTYLSTDRPMYRPGEVVRFRSLTLERFSLRPAGQDLNLRFRITGLNSQELYKHDVSTKLVAGKDKAPVLGPDGQPLHGLGVGEFTLPRNLPGGVYTLSVAELADRFPEEKRTFIVHRWQPPRFNKDAEFHRASYGPGEQVILRGKVTPLGGVAGMPMPGGPMGGPGGPGDTNGVQVQASAVIDGMAILNASQNADADGQFSFEFTLPGNLPRGDGAVTLTFRDGGNVETLVRPLPIVLRGVTVTFYPEGGPHLVPGVPNRVYFEAHTGTVVGAGKPVDVRGRLLERAVVTTDKKNKPVLSDKFKDITDVRTFTDDTEPGLNQGRGVFTFTPREGHRYEVKLDVPVGIATTFNLPAVNRNDIALHVAEGVVGRDIPVSVFAPFGNRDLLVGAYCRGKLLASAAVQAKAGERADVTLRPEADVGGVYRITVFERNGPPPTPLVAKAERLVYRKPTTRLHVAIAPDKDVYSPRDRATVRLRATTETGQATPAVTMFAVVESGVLKLTGDKRARTMPTHFLLTSEVREPQDLENTDVLLGDHPRAAEGLDLLLGTQGWRRFAEQDPKKQTQNPDRRRPASFLAWSRTTTHVSAGEQQAQRRIDAQFIGPILSLEEELAKKEHEEAGPPELQQRLAIAEAAATAAAETLNDRRMRLEDLWTLFNYGAFGLGAALFLFFAFFLVANGLHRLAEGRRGYVFFGAGLFLLASMFLISVLGTFALMGAHHDRLLARFGRNFGGFAMKAPAGAVMVQPGGMPLPPGAAIPADELARLAEDEETADQPPEPPAFAGPGGAEPMPPGGVVQLPNVRNPEGRIGLPHGEERILRQQGRYLDILQRRLGRKLAAAPPASAGLVRVYAHRNKAAGDQARRDFAETLCWQPALVLKDGTGEVQFDLSDAVTHFRVVVVSHTLDGRLGADSAEIVSRLPYSVDPKVPVEVSPSDQIIVPLAVHNDTKEPTTATFHAKAVGLRPLAEAPAIPLALGPGQTKRELFRFTPTVSEGKVSVRFEGRFAKGTDVIERKFDVAPEGFPVSESVSGTLRADRVEMRDVIMPEGWLPGTLTVQVQAFPSVLSDLQGGLDALLREPVGCFEQASSSNYPNVLILQYLQETRQAQPAAEKRARALLERGYPRLLSFECSAPGDLKVRRGYEWFGGAAPPHEALTAYGLLEFHDMARVFPVDSAMIERTRKYLLDQRDGEGGFKRNARAVDQFGRAPQQLTNAYIVWALTETGVRDELAKELDALARQAEGAGDPYFLALVALGQLNAGRTDEATKLLGRLRDIQKGTGEVAGARTSITSSAGRDLLIETTSLAALGWLRRDAALARANAPKEFHASAEKAGKWVVQQRGPGGGFGATQATVLALKALIAFAADNAQATPFGEVHLDVHVNNDGKMELSKSAAAKIAPGMADPVLVRFKDRPGEGPEPPRTVLGPGKNLLQVRLSSAKGEVPYTLSWSYRTLKPVGSGEAPLRLTTALSQAKAKEGESVKLTATLENRWGEDTGMAVAVIGLPAGLALPEDFAQLKELARLRDGGKEPGVISAWELRGRELVLYWRELKAEQKVELNLDLVCRLPGTYSGPASRAYLYYNADTKHWVDPLRIVIDPAP